MSISDYYTEIITIKTLTTGDWNSEGTWSTGTVVSAAVNPHQGQEIFSGDKDVSVADHKIFCAASVSVTPKSRIYWGSSTLDIISVKNTLNKGHHKVILAREHK